MKVGEEEWLESMLSEDVFLGYVFDTGTGWRGDD